MAVIDASVINIPLTFEVYPANLLGTKFTNWTPTSILSARDAMHFDDVAAMHKQVYPTLPAEVEDNYKSYQYVRGVTQDGTYMILGIPWIKEASIIVAGTGVLFIRVNNFVPNNENIANVRKALSSYGYTAVTTSTSPLGES